MFSSKPSFNADKCKTNLKMLVTRIQLLVQKKTNLNKQQKRKAALLLRDEKAAEAEILVEHIIREDYTIESYELLRQYAEMITARFNVVVSEPELRPEVAEAVSAILYSGWLMGNDVPELKALNILFTAKYGVAYAEEVKKNKEKYLNKRLLGVLTSTQVPDRSVTRLYLTEIAKAYNVNWTPPPENTVPQPVSASLGVPLPLPGMPVAGSPVLVGDTPAASGGPSAAQIAAAIASDTPPTPAPAQPVQAQPVLPPPGVPVGQGVPLPQMPAASGGGVPFSLELTKTAADGFGLSLNSDNVVISVKPNSDAERSDLIQPGDLVVALNGIAVSHDRPVKSVAIDVEIGASATFSMFRHHEGGGGSALPPSPGASSELPYGLPPAAGVPTMTPSSAVGVPVVAQPADSGESEDDALARRLEMLKRS